MSRRTVIAALVECRLRRTYRSLKAGLAAAKLEARRADIRRVAISRHKKAPDDAGAFELLI